MKHRFFKIISLILALSCVFIFAGCGDDNSKEQENTQSTQETTASKKSDNPLMGTWQFVDENGEYQTLFSYIFEDDNTAALAMGNVLYYSELKLEKNKEGKDTLTAQLFYNINGTYEYEITDNGETLTIASEAETQVMKKVEDYKAVPNPPEKPEIDQKLIGTWKDEGGAGVTYTFNENGIMENNSYGIMKIYATFSAKDGKISYTYNQGTDVDESYDYSFNGDVLVIDNGRFIKE